LTGFANITELDCDRCVGRIDVGMLAEKQRAELLGLAALKDMNDLDRQLSGTEAREPSSDGLINLDHNDFKSIKIAVP
jgi:hypothetical protein